MNGKKAKAIRRRALQEMIDWYKGLLGPEEADKVSKNNIFELIPKQTHFRALGPVSYTHLTLPTILRV